jgi:hypothetical protein
MSAAARPTSATSTVQIAPSARDSQFRFRHDGNHLSAPHPRAVSKEATRRSASGHPGYEI